MLSILIPIYNWHLTTLVEELHQQCLTCQIDFEIICFDDGSTQSYKTGNRIISILSNVLYKELPTNLGRAKIRNALAAAAQYPYLLFMDADAKVFSPTFIQKYLQQVHPTTLLYGGCVYNSKPPADTKKRLHYYFGKHREEIPTEERKLTPYHSFKTFNFLVPKKIFDAIQFDESIEQYGHEDTLFGMALQQKQIPIVHIDNSLEHLGLQDTSDFLSKQQEAIDTLYQLHLDNKGIDTRLLQVFKKCNQLGIQKIVGFCLSILSPLIDRQLKRSKPRIFFLDLYKLSYLFKLAKNKICSY